MDLDDGLMLNLTSSSSSFSDVGPLVDRRSKREAKWKHKNAQKFRKVGHELDYSQGDATLAVPRQPKAGKSKSKKSEDANLEEKRQIKGHVKDIIKNKGRFTHSKESSKSGEFQVVSSLFRHNPSIPEVEKPETKDKLIDSSPLFTGEKFSELPLSDHMISNLEKNLEVTTLTSVQKSALPVILGGKDVFVKSKTGSGKTLCYAVPVVQTLQNIQPKIERSDGPYAMILVPTRELALQSFTILQKLVKPFQWVVPGLVIGGEKRKSEKARLRKGINILVATPGRLLDHIKKTKCLKFTNIHWIVLDEADRLLDMGFEKDVSAVTSAVKREMRGERSCQTVLLSATLTSGVERLVDIALQNPHFIDESELTNHTEQDSTKDAATKKLETAQIPHQLKQYFLIVPSKMRLVSLAAFVLSKFKHSRHTKMIVFLSSRDSVDFHYNLFVKCLKLEQGGELKWYKLHGNMSQTERTDVYKKYSSSEEGVLLCTDVAARGLDLPHVSWIIQYDTPGSAVDYIHRVGRTARIGTEGHALLFLTPSEVAYLKTLGEHGIRPDELSVSSVLQTLVSSVRKGKGKGPQERETQGAATNLQMEFEKHVISDPDDLKAAKKAFQSFVRSYATFPASLKHIFHVHNLHLGHVAKAFALRDPPRGISGTKTKKRKRQNRAVIKPSVKKRKLVTDEYSGELAKQGPRPKKKLKPQRPRTR